MLMGQSGQADHTLAAPCAGLVPDPVVMMNIPSIPLPVVYVPMVNQNEIFLAGFRDCGQEAVRYLVEEERLSPADPLITGLQDYLRQQEAQVNIQAAVYQHNQQQQQYPQYYPNYLYHHHVNVDNHKVAYQQVEQPQVQLPVDLEEKVTLDDSGLTLDTSMTSSMCDDDAIEDCDKDSGVSVSEDELAAGAMELNQLAQNNPSINKLLTELFELFEEEEESDSDEEEMDL